MLIYLQMIDGPEDRSKFEQLYLAYRGLMYFIAESILGNEQDAEDAVHDAFVSVAKNISKIADPERAKPKRTSLQLSKARPSIYTAGRSGTNLYS